MKLGTTPWDLSDRSAAGLAAQAALAERLGYDSFWVPESHFGPNAIPEPLLLLAAVAASTSQIRLGTTSLLLPLRNPLQVAEQVAVLDQLSGGRVILGVGRGYAAPMLRAFDVEPRDKRTLFEARLEVILRAWQGLPVSDVEAGADAMRLDPLPVQQPHPPIWVAAFGPKALAQAGRLGLPWLASPVEGIEVLLQNQATHAAALVAAGHPPARINPVMRTVFVTESATEAADLRDRLHAESARHAVVAAPADLDSWAVIGEAGFVRERLLAWQEQLAITHLIIARIRLGGLSRDRLARNAERIAALFA